MSFVSHCETFYYVYKCHGLSEASRHIRVITPSAVSKSIKRLESHMNVTLWNRESSEPTAAGVELWGIIGNLFEALEAFRRKYNGPRVLRIGASEFVMRQYLPGVLEQMQREKPDVGFALHPGSTAQIADWVAHSKVDVGIASVDTLPPKVNKLTLCRLPLVLLAPTKLRFRDPNELLSRKDAPRFVVPAADEPLTRRFHAGMQARNLPCPTQLDAGSLALMTWFVKRTGGIGVTLAVPGLTDLVGVRAVPLEGFDPVEICLYWREPANPLLETFRTVAERERAKFPELL